MHRICAYYNPVDYSARKENIEMEFSINNENESKDISQSVSHDDVSPMYRKIEKILNKVSKSPSLNSKQTILKILILLSF